MKAIVNRLLSNNLDELKGLKIEGEIPLKEEFLNELIQTFLEGSSLSTESSAGRATSEDQGIDFKQLLNALDKKELKVELKEKVALIKISARKF